MDVCVWQGQRVKLRAVEPTDWETFFDSDQDSQAARESYHIPFPRSREATKRWAEEIAMEKSEGDAFRWVIADLTGTVVGTINTHSCDRRHGRFGYGLAVRGEYQRKGYASEAIRLVLRYFFEELRYHKATVQVYAVNEASIRLHQKLGFQEEGRSRDMIYTQGRYVDELTFGLTFDEWASAPLSRFE